jgi:hypothetical protein
MAMAMDAFGSVFGEAKPPVTIRMRPVLFHAHAHAHTDDVSQLCLLATDLHSHAWDRSLFLSDIDDLVSPFSSQSLISISLTNRIVLFQRDDVGIGGSCSDFLDYLKSCLSSGEVNLIFPHNGQYPNYLYHAFLHYTTLPIFPMLIWIILQGLIAFILLLQRQRVYLASPFPSIPLLTPH